MLCNVKEMKQLYIVFYNLKICRLHAIINNCKSDIMLEANLVLKT